jgi:16S rRNA (uracil1498-N3)-methyltransferase
MNLFYTHRFEDQMAIFEEEEARHLFVLRKKEGDLLQFTDGKGNLFQGIISSSQRKNCYVHVTETKPNYRPNPYSLHIAIAPTKNMDRLEWFLEKVTEIGITSITPILCQHSERDKIRLDRLESILVSSMKQSLQTFLPQLHPLCSFKDFVSQWKDYAGAKAIAYCNDAETPFITAIKHPANDYLICIGPEGDFSPSEIELAFENKFQGISLGKNRLRTETAGIFAAASIAAWHY